jgi:hypothetical protein
MRAAARLSEALTARTRSMDHWSVKMSTWAIAVKGSGGGV